MANYDRETEARIAAYVTDNYHQSFEMNDWWTAKNADGSVLVTVELKARVTLDKDEMARVMADS